MMNEAARTNLRNIIILALADGKLDDAEKRFIETLRVRLGVDEAQFKQLCVEVGQNPKKFALPEDHGDAVEAIGLLVEMAVADGVVGDDEKRIIRQLAGQAGLDEMEIARLFQADVEAEARIEAMIEEIYSEFQSWDDAGRKVKFDALGAMGSASAIQLLRMFESYRRPVDAETALEMKVMVADQLGKMADSRAIYYFAQQVNLGDMEDEVTNLTLRLASVQAIGKCAGETFPPGQDGIVAARQWWMSTGGKDFNKLAF